MITLEGYLSCLYHTRKDTLRYTRSGWRIPDEIKSKGYGDACINNYGIYVCPDSSWKVRSEGELIMTYAGHVIFMCGGAIDWACKLVRVICHSSSEAEICAGCFAAKRLQFIRSLLNEMHERKMQYVRNTPQNPERYSQIPERV